MQWPALKNNEVLVFVSHDHQDNDQSRLLSQISVEEEQQFNKFYFDKDRRLYLLSHALLRMCLAHYCQCNIQDIAFKKNKYGKPVLLNDPQLQFNLSHSHHAMAIALHKRADLDLGIDIENRLREKTIIDLANHYFSEQECQMLNSYPQTQQQEVFFKLWTLKESYIKAIGKGLSIDLESFSFASLDHDISIQHYNHNEQQNHWRFFQATIFNDYHLALATRSSKGQINQLKPHTYEYTSINTIVEKSISYCY